MSEQEVLEKYSTPGLRRSQLTRTSKKLNMEFDERLHGMTMKDRDDFLDKHFPEDNLVSDQVLGGELKAHFAFGSPEEQGVKLEEARLEQEVMAGYPLVVRHVRQTHYIDEHGQDIYEAWATFAPVPPPAPTDGTQV